MGAVEIYAEAHLAMRNIRPGYRIHSRDVSPPLTHTLNRNIRPGYRIHSRDVPPPLHTHFIEISGLDTGYILEMFSHEKYQAWIQDTF